MKVGPFALLPGGLAVVQVSGLETWEDSAKKLFEIQRNIPWWIGDMVNFGEAQWGDDFWQVVPMDVSERMIEMYAGVARKYPPADRFKSLSWTHHVTALKVADPVLRRGLLRKAEGDRLNSEEFSSYVSRFIKSRKGSGA